jgi:hypothetical protein
VVGVTLLQPLDIVTFWETDLFVEQMEQPDRLLFDEIKDRLIVDEHDGIIGDLLGDVCLLLFLEGVCIEMLLQLLVGEVDAGNEGVGG